MTTHPWPTVRSNRKEVSKEQLRPQEIQGAPVIFEKRLKGYPEVIFRERGKIIPSKLPLFSVMFMLSMSLPIITWSEFEAKREGGSLTSHPRPKKMPIILVKEPRPTNLKN